MSLNVVDFFLKHLIADAGQICKKEQLTLQVSDLDFKSKKDLVTSTDKKVEKFIIRHIKQKYPDHAIWGEETGKCDTASDYLWIIDPIDGTTSFFHRQPFYSISIAVQYKGKSIFGAVYAPAFDELFFASENGAFLNDSPIHVSCTDQLVQSVMATGFACLREDKPKNNLPYFTALVPQLRDIRRYGSAAIDLCYVACGRLDGFWELNLNVYDIAAGVLILEKAGGKISDFNGNHFFPEHGIVASNDLLHNAMLQNFNLIHEKKEK